MDLRERAVDRLSRAVRSQTPRGDEPEHHDDRLVVVQHQRGQPVARAHAVPAADSALPLDGDAELLQRGDVAPDGPTVDGEPVGDLPPCRERPRLEELEELEQPGSGRRHAAK
jgi:hypothetical protein